MHTKCHARAHIDLLFSEQAVSQGGQEELSTGDAVVPLVSSCSVISGVLEALKRQALLMFDHHLGIQVAAAMVLIT